MRVNSCSRKVVAVLDHGSRFAIDSGATVPVSIKQQGGPQTQIAAASKSLWTWCVEGLLEYHRIVSDLYFDSDKLLRVAVADSVGTLLNPWGESLVSYHNLTKLLSKVGPPKKSGDDCIPIAGILMAIDALSQKTEIQVKGVVNEKARPAEREVGGSGPEAILSTEDGPATNDGSIIVFCNLKSAKELSDIQQLVSSSIAARNQQVANLKDGMVMPIDTVDLYIINTFAVGGAVGVPSTPKQLISPNLSCTVVCRQAGDQLISAAHAVCLTIYDLVSTTVSGIPMKEEAQQGQSTNYDVELLHPRASHNVLEMLKLCGAEGFLKDESRQTSYPTYKLHWSTPSPKNKWNLFPKTMSALRVTPAAVNSRPSVCLTSFLLGGRNVMLEVKRAGPAEHMKPNVKDKLISHTLIAHQGRIYIHAIDIIPNNVMEKKGPKRKTVSAWELDDSDEEDVKMEVKNISSMKKMESEEAREKALKLGNTARNADFVLLMKECFLRPKKATDKAQKVENVPCAQPLKRLRRLTRYWPVFKEDTLIFQAPEKFSELYTLFRKTDLSATDVENCKKAVYRLVSLKDEKPPMFKANLKSRLLPEPRIKDEVYKAAMVELASYMGNYVNNSDAHQEILKLLIQVVDLDKLVTIPTQDVPSLNADKVPEPRSIENVAQSAPTTATSSRSSSPAPKKSRKTGGTWNVGDRVNVYDFMCSREAPRFGGRPDFVGRAEAGSRIAPLYKNLDISTAPGRGEVAM